MANINNLLKSSGSVMLNANNYNLWQYENFKPYISGRVLEIGCGLGNLTELIIHNANEVVSVDIKKEAAEFTRNRIKNNNLNVYNVDVFSDKSLKKLGKFDTIVFCNVLEHIKDDNKAISFCERYLKDNQSKLILLVPAHQFIFGTLDDEVGHYKRYCKADIVRFSEQNDLNLLKNYYFNSIGAVGWFVNYKLLKRKNTNEGDGNFQVNFFDKYIVNIVRLLESVIRPPFGISLISILEKKV